MLKRAAHALIQARNCPPPMQSRNLCWARRRAKTSVGVSLHGGDYGVDVSVPFGISTPDQPNISSTRWRTVSDQKRKRYFFESALTPNTFWVDLDKFDLSAETGQVMKLELGPEEQNIYSGEASGAFKPAEPFKFIGLP